MRHMSILWTFMRWKGNIVMTNTELLNAIDSQIATLALNTERVRGTSLDKFEIVACISKEIAYQECRNIVLSLMAANNE